MNWFILVGGIAITFATNADGSAPRWLVWIAAAGAGAAIAVAWEAAEYTIMRAGVGGLHLTYGDTITDLLLSTTGGALGASMALRNGKVIARQPVSTALPV